ncbi:phosphotransferase [Alicyclobacillus dauci]|uniref:Phosphotransferase n=1 Tax=Alicyclobacillus dauci TaxID=1475485 RepID=A0ABY6Z6A9_9BACL|nr:phosphotransferase [Alicyclobacillus dauci]WAH38416.1 phosphotransferase [Alicyclobacillus dauci]
MSPHAELVQAVSRWYGIDARAIVRRRTVQGIVAVDGSRYIWKPLSLRDDEERLAALAGLQDVFAESDTATALPLPTRDGHFIVRFSDQQGGGYLQPWLSGRHVEVAVRRERLAVIRSIARIQRSSQRLGFPHWSRLQRGTLLQKLRLKERAFSKIWTTLESEYAPLRAWKSKLQRQMQTVLQRYTAYLAEHQGQIKTHFAFCHRDLAPHNVLFQPNKGVAWIDFDHANYDDMLHDVMQFISHTTFLAQLSSEDFREMIDTYVEESEMSRDRTNLLWTLSAWPDILVRTLMEWYRNGCPADGVTRLDYAIACERRKEQYRLDAGVDMVRLDA